MPGSVCELFSRALPEYMAIGMTPEEFYEGPCWLCGAYRKAHRSRIEMFDQQAWMQGAYAFRAVSTALSNAFRKRGTAPIDWPEAPMFTARDPEERIEGTGQQNKAVAFFQAYAEAHNEKLRREGETKDTT